MPHETVVIGNQKFKKFSLTFEDASFSYFLPENSNAFEEAKFNCSNIATTYCGIQRFSKSCSTLAATCHQYVKNGDYYGGPWQLIELLTCKHSNKREQFKQIFGAIIMQQGQQTTKAPISHPASEDNSTQVQQSQSHHSITNTTLPQGNSITPHPQPSLRSIPLTKTRTLEIIEPSILYSKRTLTLQISNSTTTFNKPPLFYSKPCVDFPFSFAMFDSRKSNAGASIKKLTELSNDKQREKTQIIIALIEKVSSFINCSIEEILQLIITRFDILTTFSQSESLSSLRKIVSALNVGLRDKEAILFTLDYLQISDKRFEFFYSWLNLLPTVFSRRTIADERVVYNEYLRVKYQVSTSDCGAELNMQVLLQNIYKLLKLKNYNKPFISFQHVLDSRQEWTKSLIVLKDTDIFSTQSFDACFYLSMYKCLKSEDLPQIKKYNSKTIELLPKLLRKEIDMGFDVKGIESSDFKVQYETFVKSCVCNRCKAT